jgi:Ulp1 family protease
LIVALKANTSPVNVDGMHWVSILIDNKMKSIEFFDPVGNPYKKNPYFKQTMSMIQNIFPKHSVIVNKQQHQMKNGQCGVSERTPNIPSKRNLCKKSAGNPQDLCRVG